MSSTLLIVIVMLLNLLPFSFTTYFYLNNSPTYVNITESYVKSKPNLILVFIAITSGPSHSHLRHAIRMTWLLPCKASNLCNYKFFIDITESRISANLIDEMAKYEDVVFRDFCPLMKRHHPNINYGNSAPVSENLPNKLKSDEGQVPDYLHRRFYKIDWKVCFMVWCSYSNITADYHVYVEDDSFVSTENLLYQLALVKNKQFRLRRSNSTNKVLGFRTGTPLYDGFDDSSTIISNDVVNMFVKYYVTGELNCTNVYNNIYHSNLSILNSAHDIYVWLSWGNSWRQQNCDWRNELRKKNFELNIPNVVCLNAVFRLQANHTNNYETKLFLMIKNKNFIHKLKKNIEDKNLLNNIEIFDYCSDRSLIFHHHFAGMELIDDKDRLLNFPKHLLLIDKVKEPKYMFNLWDINQLFLNKYINETLNSSNNSNLDNLYTDYSEIFLHDDYYGWEKFFLSYYQLISKFCNANMNYTECHSIFTRRQLTVLKGLGLR